VDLFFDTIHSPVRRYMQRPKENENPKMEEKMNENLDALCGCFWWSANNSGGVTSQLLLFSGEWS
jgi:hypothetical protein